MSLTSTASIRWFVAPFALFLAFSYATYDPPLVPRVNVRWSEAITTSQREALEVTYDLREAEQAQERTWTYGIHDTSTGNLRRLVEDPAVEDTNGVDRTAFTITQPLPAPMNALFRFLGLSSLVALVVALVVTWLGPGLWGRVRTLPVARDLPRWDWRRWAQVLIDIGSGGLAPLVLFVVLFDDVVATNVRELRYLPSLVRGFHVAAVLGAGLGWWIVRQYGAGVPARVWLAVPWAVLLLDVVGAALRSFPLGVAALADLLLLGGVVAAAVAVPWPDFQKVAAVAAVAFMTQTGMAHAALVRGLTPDLISGRPVDLTPELPPAPAPDAPGNVYHILLDNYLAESFAALADQDTRASLPGFTFFSRFNSQFPRTATSEPALLHGRLPEPGLSLSQWPETVLREGFWRDLAAAGRGVWVYPYARWLCPGYAAVCVSGSDIEQGQQATMTRDATLDLWAIRLMPASLRRALAVRPAATGEADSQAVGYSVTTALRTLFGRQTTALSASPLISANPGQYFNLRQFDQVLADEPLRPARGQYVYYHALIPHTPYLFDDECEPLETVEATKARYFDFARCANLMVARLVDVLADLGRLDDALIIVHADHGDVEFLLRPESPSGPDAAFALDTVARSYQEPDLAYLDRTMLDQLLNGDSAEWRSIAVEVFSSALLLVKFPQATGYAEDARPVQLIDLAPTVLSHFGLSTGTYDGMPISRVPATREASFYAHARQTFDKLSRYTLGAGGWEFVEDLPLAP